MLEAHLPGHGALVVAGPDARHGALHRGLDQVDARTDVVVVHDSSRPLASVAVLLSVIEAVRGGAVFAVPVVEITETVKELDETGRVRATVPRETLLRVQTPQAGHRAALIAAHLDCGLAELGSDEVLLPRPAVATADGAGFPVAVATADGSGPRVACVPGHPRAFPVLTAADLALAEALLAADTAEPGLSPGSEPAG